MISVLLRSDSKRFPIKRRKSVTGFVIQDVTIERSEANQMSNRRINGGRCFGFKLSRENLSLRFNDVI